MRARRERLPNPGGNTCYIAWFPLAAVCPPPTRAPLCLACAAWCVHGKAEDGHERTRIMIYGPVVTSRIAYRRRGKENLYPQDGELNWAADHGALVVYDHQR